MVKANLQITAHLDILPHNVHHTNTKSFVVCHPYHTLYNKTALAFFIASRSFVLYCVHTAHTQKKSIYIYITTNISQLTERQLYKQPTRTANTPEKNMNTYRSPSIYNYKNLSTIYKDILYGRSQPITITRPPVDGLICIERVYTISYILHISNSLIHFQVTIKIH